MPLLYPPDLPGGECRFSLLRFFLTLGAKSWEAGAARRARAKQFKSGSAIPLALQCLQPIDVNFHRPIAPALFNDRLDCTLVLFQGAHKTLHSINAGGVGPPQSKSAAS